MTRDQLMKRLVKKEGKPPIKKATPIKMMRRDENYVVMERDDSLEYDDFFDFEKELSENEMVSSRQLAASAPGSESFFNPDQESVAEEKESPSKQGFLIMEREDNEQEQIPPSSFFVLEKNQELEEEQKEESEEESAKEPDNFTFKYKDEKEKIITDSDKNSDDKNSAKTYKDVVGFDFIQCSYIKDNGERCKRQAPKGHDICTIHRKVLEKKKGK